MYIQLDETLSRVLMVSNYCQKCNRLLFKIITPTALSESL